MMKFNRLHLSLLALGLTTGVVSTASAIAQDAKARQHGGWYAELEAFHAQANDSLLSTLPYAETNLFESTATLGIGEFSSNESRFHTFDSDYNWGYRAAIGYDYPSCNCSNYGFSLEYTYHKSDDDRHLRGFINSEGEPVLDDFYGFFDADATDADANYEFKYHAVDLLGHRNLSACGVDLQFFTGARYVRLKQDLNRHLFVSEELVGLVPVDEDISDFFSYYNSKFDGVGPRVGFNAFYQVCNGFGLVTEVAGNLLFGNANDCYSERVTDIERRDDISFPVDVFEGTHQTKHHKNALSVPGLSGKVGVAYRTVFSNCSSLSVEVGYRGEKYFGIGFHSSLVLPTDFTAGFIKDGNYHDYDISGPYINVAFHA